MIPGAKARQLLISTSATNVLLQMEGLMMIETLDEILLPLVAVGLAEMGDKNHHWPQDCHCNHSQERIALHKP